MGAAASSSFKVRRGSSLPLELELEQHKRYDSDPGTGKRRDELRARAEAFTKTRDGNKDEEPAVGAEIVTDSRLPAEGNNTTSAATEEDAAAGEDVEESKAACNEGKLGEQGGSGKCIGGGDRMPARPRSKPKRRSTDARLNDLKRGTALYQPTCTTLDDESAEYVTVLPRGGHWCKLGDLTLQIGCPPETIKDSMQLGLDVPRYFVVLGDLFSRTKGVNFAELEFPAYFNFFIRKQKTVVLTTASIEARIRCLFRETLLGPAAEDLRIEKDFPEGTPSDCFPNFRNEGEWLDPARKTLTVDSLLEFRNFRPVDAEKDGDGGETVEVDLGNGIRVTYDCEARKYVIEAPNHIRPEIKNLVVHMEDVIQRIENGLDLNTRLRDTVTTRELLDPPTFGVTMLGTSHGFDPNGQTTGFVVWANRRGTMVDPPPMALECLDQLGISSRMIDSIVLTHCHSDHDAGAFRRLLFDQHITIFSTWTIIESFIRKYSSVTGFSRDFLKQLLLVRFVHIGQDIFIHGATWRFFYSLHTIPCIGFQVTLDSKSIAYSADTHASQDLFDRMYADGILGEGRMKSLSNFPWQSDMILHEAGVPPIHTPMTELVKLPDDIKEKLFLVHIAQKDIPSDCGFRSLQQGDTQRIPVSHNNMEGAIEILDVLSTIDLFKDACRTFTDALQAMYLMEMREFRQGELIVRAGDPGDTFYIITRGTAEVSWMQNGSRASKCFFVGDYFGETSLVTGEPRNADVCARGHVRVACLSRKTFEELIRGTDIKQNLIALANIRAKNSWQLISNNSVTRLLTSTAKTQLEFAMIERVFERGEIIWEFGDAPEFVMFIQEGQFHLKADQAHLRDRRINLSISVDKETGGMKILDSIRRSNNPLRKSTCADASTAGQEVEAESSATDGVSVRVSNSEIDVAAFGITEGIATSGAFIGDFDAVFSDQPVASTVVCLEPGKGLLIPREKWKQFCGNFPGGLLFFMNKHITI